MTGDRKDETAQPPREPGSDADQPRRDIETDPALSPVGPLGGAAISPLKPGRRDED